MSQAPTNGTNLMDPFGIWKAARDANLESWSKLMIDIVNSDEYARSTGFALEQILATSQPLRDNMEKSMTQALSMLNMPSRAEVISIAERLVNVEMRLDDLDAKLNTMQESLQATIKAAVSSNANTQNSHMRSMETQLQAISTMLASMQTPARAATPPKAETKAETKAEDKPTHPVAKKEEAK